jgi:hypothetical protein
MVNKSQHSTKFNKPSMVYKAPCMKNRYVSYKQEGNRTYKFIIGKPYFFTINLAQLSSRKIFTDAIYSNLQSDENYFILVKVRYSQDRYMMLSKQSILNYVEPYTENIENFRIEIINKLSNILESYNVDMEEVLDLNILVSQVDKRFISDLKADTSYLDEGQETLIKKAIKFFPLENNSDVLGNEITDITYGDDGLVKKIKPSRSS